MSQISDLIRKVYSKPIEIPQVESRLKLFPKDQPLPPGYKRLEEVSAAEMLAITVIELERAGLFEFAAEYGKQ